MAYTQQKPCLRVAGPAEQEDQPIKMPACMLCGVWLQQRRLDFSMPWLVVETSCNAAQSCRALLCSEVMVLGMQPDACTGLLARPRVNVELILTRC